MKRISLLLTVIIVFFGFAGAQDNNIGFNETDPDFGVMNEKEVSNAGKLIINNMNYVGGLALRASVLVDVDVIPPREEIRDYEGKGNYILFNKISYENGATKDPVQIKIWTVFNETLKYSLYTYKKDFPQDGKRNMMQGLRESKIVNPHCSPTPKKS